MANEEQSEILKRVFAQGEHLEILKRGVKGWNEWRRDHRTVWPWLNDADLDRANLRGVNLGGTVLTGTTLKGTLLDDANLKRASLGRADFQGASLIRANLEGARLEGANFESTDLFAANLLGVSVDANTSFAGADVRGCIIDRQTLDLLEDNGGLSIGARSRMDIRDDVADLRLSFSGMRLWLHLFALMAFLFPYLAFIGQRYFEARFFNEAGSETVPLWKAIARYIWNGGQNWQTEFDLHWTFVTFVALCIYNIGRWLLLSKTVELEHRGQVSGLPVPFVLEREPFWNRLVKTMNWLFWIGLIILAFNTAHFLTQEVPI